MKKTILSIYAASALLFAGCGPGQQEAVKYNDSFIAIETALTPVYNAFIRQTDGHNIDSLKLTYQAFAAKTRNCLEEVRKIQPFAEKRDYLDAIIAYFTTLNNLAQTEARQMVDLMSKDSTLITEEDLANAGKYADQFNASYEQALKAAQQAQAAFAKEWKFKVE